MDLVPMYRRSAVPITAAVVRLLVAIEPQMYREVIALNFRQEHPRSEVVLASKQNLRAEAESVRPHLIFANGEVPPQLKERGIFWVEVRADDRLDATISANGYSDTIHDVSVQNLLEVVDKTLEEFAHGG